MKTQFRNATENDCALILEFIKALAEYEKMSDDVVATEELLRVILPALGYTYRTVRLTASDANS